VELALEHDQEMAPVHFVLDADDLGCFVTDNRSPGGTFVNGRSIGERMRLQHGDAIYAGRTLFRVLVESEAATRRSGATPAAGGTRSRPTTPVNFTTETCNTKLTLCRGAVEEIGSGALAETFARSRHVYLIVDFNKLGQPLPAHLTSPEYLFNWLDPAVVALASPVIVPNEDLPDWPKMVEEAWGQDAVVCFFAQGDRQTLIEHLRARTRVKGGGAAGSVLGWCWPSVLAPLLAYSTPETAQQLLAGIDAVLVELPDLPETWQIYGTDRLADELVGLGFVRQQPVEAVEGKDA